MPPPSAPPPGQDDRGDFAESAASIARYLADYWRSVERWPVRSAVSPGDILARLPAHAPEEGDPGALGPSLLRELDELIMPGLTHWQSPGFFAYFPANISPPAVLGELLAAGLGVQGMLWSTSPACTELEMRMMDWLGEAIGLPGSFLFGPAGAAAPGGGVIQGTASESTLVALLAARARALKGVPREQRRHAAARLTCYASTQAHSSILKAALIAGLALDTEDREQLRFIPTDASLALDAGALSEAIRRDKASGLIPCCVVASVGTTSTTAVDPVRAIARVIGAECPGAWLHVDAAYSGAACVCPEFRWMLDGIEHADSVGVNPHKWLLTNFDAGCFWTRDRAGLVGAMSVTPEYLRNPATDAGRVVDYRDWHVPLGRRFRALKLWLVMRSYGLSGLRAHIRHHVRLAALFESLVRDDPRFEIAAPRTTALVCFRLRPAPGEAPGATDARNQALLDAMNATGRVFLTHTRLPGAGASPGPLVLRLAVGAVQTQEQHVRGAWDLARNLAGTCP